MFGAVVLGLLFALANDRGHAIVRLIYWLYITVVRGTPLLLQLVFVYTVLPLAGVKLGVAEAALLALVANELAYIAEIIRSGLEAIPVGQREAAYASGLNSWQTEFLVVVPQAIRIVIPTIGNQVNAMFKYTSLVSVISMTELFQATQEIADATFQFLEIYAVAALYYLAMTFVWTLIQSRIERVTAIPGSHADRRRSNPVRDLAVGLVGLVTR
jgi:polar amino acid transport system permease protein